MSFTHTNTHTQRLTCGLSEDVLSGDFGLTSGESVGDVTSRGDVFGVGSPIKMRRVPLRTMNEHNNSSQRHCEKLAFSWNRLRRHRHRCLMRLTCAMRLTSVTHWANWSCFCREASVM